MNRIFRNDSKLILFSDKKNTGQAGIVDDVGSETQ